VGQECLSRLWAQPHDGRLDAREHITRFEQALQIDANERHIVGGHMTFGVASPGLLCAVPQQVRGHAAEIGLRAVDELQLVGIDQQRLLESRDMLARVEAAVMRLRPRTREIFLAHRVEGLSYGEIAQRTGLSAKGVEKQMSKAIAAIDRLIEQDRA
jgi:RNA polymerase sigma factor (sigma-70 family)